MIILLKHFKKKFLFLPKKMFAFKEYTKKKYFIFRNDFYMVQVIPVLYNMVLQNYSRSKWPPYPNVVFFFSFFLQMRIAATMQHRGDQQHLWRSLPRHPQVHGGPLHVSTIGGGGRPRRHHRRQSACPAAVAVGSVGHAAAAATETQDNNNSIYNQCCHHQHNFCTHHNRGGVIIAGF
jgi:hypothetical protein